MRVAVVADSESHALSTAREYLDRIRVKYVEVGRPAPTKVDLLRRAVEDGILPELDPDAIDDEAQRARFCEQLRQPLGPAQRQRPPHRLAHLLIEARRHVWPAMAHSLPAASITTS